MIEKKLVIVDLKEDSQLKYDKVSYIYLNQGTINFKNSKKIFLDSLRKKNFLSLKKNILKKLLHKVNASKKICQFFPELSFFNLRNDKEPNFDLLLNILLVNQYKKTTKIKKTIVITDNELTNKFFSTKKGYNVIFKKKKSNFYIDLYRFKLAKFYVKSFFVILFAKLFHKKIAYKKNYNQAYITLYPFFFNNNNERFFDKHKSLKINFLMGDETHIKNCNLITIIKNLTKNKTKNLVNIEAMISFKDLFRSYQKANYYLSLKKKINYDLILDGCNFKEFYKGNVSASLHNRLKLEIYNQAIKRIVEVNKIKEIHLYLFEYSFGFYLIKQFKNNSKKIKVFGYQHGFFYKNLPWLELISKIRSYKNYCPDYIYAFSNKAMNHYKIFYSDNNIIYRLNKKKVSDVAKKIKYSKNNNNVLIILGGHDTFEIIKNINDYLKNNDLNKYNYFVKPHPKIKINISSDSKLIPLQKITKINFQKVIISPTTAVVYDMIKLKKPFYIFDIDYKFKYVPDTNYFRFG